MENKHRKEFRELFIDSLREVKRELVLKKRIIAIIVILIALFGWFEIRPALIKHNCVNENPSTKWYQRCLHEHGL